MQMQSARECRCPGPFSKLMQGFGETPNGAGDFRRAIGNSPPHAFQVWRADFDRMLFEHARSCGASAREGHEAVQCEQLGPRDTRLEVRTELRRLPRHPARPPESGSFRARA